MIDSTMTINYPINQNWHRYIALPSSWKSLTFWPLDWLLNNSLTMLSRDSVAQIKFHFTLLITNSIKFSISIQVSSRRENFTSWNLRFAIDWESLAFQNITKLQLHVRKHFDATLLSWKLIFIIKSVWKPLFCTL